MIFDPKKKYKSRYILLKLYRESGNPTYRVYDINSHLCTIRGVDLDKIKNISSNDFELHWGLETNIKFFRYYPHHVIYEFDSIPSFDHFRDIPEELI